MKRATKKTHMHQPVTIIDEREDKENKKSVKKIRCVVCSLFLLWSIYFRMVYQSWTNNDIPVNSNLIGIAETSYMKDEEVAEQVFSTNNDKVAEQASFSTSDGSLGCDEMKNVEFIQVLNAGGIKQAIEVKLPNGKFAIAKRCITSKCVKGQYLLKETGLLKGLKNNTIGENNTIAFYGVCDVPYGKIYNTTKRGKSRDEYIKSIASDLMGGGYTLLVEKAKSLIVTNFNESSRKIARQLSTCIAKNFTALDLEDFRAIARMYASNPVSPCQFKRRGFGDSIYFDQWAFATNGIVNIDVDEVWCSDDLSYEDALEFNCRTVRSLTRRAKLNCSLAHSMENPVQKVDINQRVDFLHSIGDTCRSKK